MITNKRRRNGFVCTAAALVSAAVLAPMALGQHSETEPNDTKATANPIPAGGGFMQPGESITGLTTGTSTTVAGNTSADNFRISVAGSVTPGIYKNVLTANSAGGTGYTMQIRGLTQTAGVINPGTDSQLQTLGTGTGLRFSQWYSFGASHEVFSRVTGVAATSSNYSLTLTREAVAPMVATTLFGAGAITISSMGQTTANTDFWVYDENFNPVADFSNNDNSLAGGGTGVGSQSIATRNLTPGTYYVAISTSNLANEQPNAADDRVQADAAWDSAGALSTGATLANADMDFTISDSAGNTQAITAIKEGPHDVVFVQFVVGAAQTIIINSTTVSPDPVTPGVTTALFTVNISPAPLPPNTITISTLDLTQLGGSAAAQMFDDGTNGDVTAGDNTYSLEYSVPLSVAPGTRIVPFVFADDGGHSVGGNIAVSVNPVQPANDECANAVVVTDAMLPYGATVGINLAGPDGFISCSTSQNVNNGIWYEYTPSQTVLFEMRETGARDVSFVLYESCGGFDVYCDATETDANTILFGGTTYKILVATPGTASSNANDTYAVTFAASPIPTPPANDDCVNAIDLTGGTFPMTFTADAGGALPDFDVSCNTASQFSAANGIWYKYTATQDVSLEVQETDANIFGQFTVYSDCGTFESACRLLGGTSANVLPLRGGQTHYILISRNRQGPANAHYDLVINIRPNPVPNGSCENAMPITAIPFSDTQNNVFAFDGPGVTCISSATFRSRNATWYTYSPEFNTNIQFRENSAQDAFITIFTGTCDGGLSQYWCNLFSPLADVTQRVRLEGGQTYYFMVARETNSDPTATDQLTFQVQDVSILPPVPDNDLCADAKVISSVYRETILNTGATNEFRNNCSAGNATLPVHNGVWFRYDNGADVATGAAWTEPPNNNASKSQIAVYSGFCPSGDLQEVACTLNSSSPESVTFAMSPNTTYYIMVANQVLLQGSADEQIPFNFAAITEPAPTPTNVTCSTATAITSVPFQTLVSSVNAPNETVTLACNTGQTGLNNALWFSYTAQANGFGVFREDGPQDAVIGVYTSCPADTAVRCASFSDVGVVQMTAGTTYYFVVGRFGATPSGPGDVWDFKFDLVAEPTHDVCETAKVITRFPFHDVVPIGALTDDAIGVTGCTAAAPQRRGVWYTFTAQDSFVLMAEEIGPQTGTRVYAAFSGTCGNFTQVGCSTNSSTTPDFDFASPLAMKIVAGETYYLLVGSRAATVTNAEQQFYDVMIYTVGSDVGRCATSVGCVLDTRQNCTGTFTPGLEPCRADFNCDVFINPDDLADFITCFFLDIQIPGFCPAADFNGDGSRDPDDLADFITTFFLTVQGGPC